MGVLTKEFFARFNINEKHDIFFETGTYNGVAILNLLKNNDIFEEYHSVEIDSARFQKCSGLFSDNSRVKLYKGDSADILKNNLSNGEYDDKKIFFWLDSHWMGDSGEQGTTHCPLLDELESIKQLNIKPTIVIDDLFFMLNRDDHRYQNPEDCSKLNNAKHWPILDEIKTKIYEINPNYEIELSLIEGREDYLIAK
tara:strand:- start:392 stop:982 length:591 start_codon:yes stop_codon:yes gene_type:complete